MKIAITSNNGKYVDTHFGKAERVLIYEITDNHARLVEIRNINIYSDDNPTHSFDEVKFNTIYKSISDCNKIYTQKIGEIPASKLIDKGIIPTVVKGTIDKIPLFKNKKMI